MAQRKKSSYRGADAAHPEKDEHPKRVSKKPEAQEHAHGKKEHPHGKIRDLRSAFQPGILVPLRPIQLELTHYCGNVMSILIDGESPDDAKFRTWAWCKPCRQLGLIHEGKWLDPSVVTEKQWVKGTSSVQ